ncbi:L-lactate permease [Heliophilum fasciatum]|uniref:L-lactate permease n=1 Tax=Heliophilum fasciatum TaxID=35700 RepID=A0A4V2SY40_9FIRM|nr:L-lactate permease [Heliophilum fasciatum]MCW2276904.1 lactate permease [Heliophilum fasciatum]TCP68636.1 lactate permease [Heliophilum fasciatum]
MVGSLLLTLLPIVVIVLLMTWRHWAADVSGVVGWLVTLLVAGVFFHTSLEVGLRASLAGTIASFPVSLMVAASIFQISFMEATGALRRIVVFVKMLAPTDRAVQIMLLNVGAGTLLVSIGATPVSILPPILLALGYSAFVAVALPAIGFDALCTFALLGAPLVVYADLTGTPLVQSAQVFAKFLPVISTMIGFGMLWIVGRWKLVKEGFIPCVLAGVTNGGMALAIAWIPALNAGVVLTGVIAGTATILMMLLYLKLLGKPILDPNLLTDEDRAVERNMSLGKALSPWLILVFLLMVTNFYGPIYDFLFKAMAMPVTVIPNQPIKTRLLWNAYTWVVISTLLSVLILRPSGKAWRETLTKWGRRAPRPTLAAAIFFAIAFVINNSGMQNVGGAWKLVEPSSNMIWVLANASSSFFGSFYPFVSAFLGLFGGFVSGSEASTIAMFTKYHLLTSEMLHVDALLVTAATAIGGGLASVISPAKLQNAAATIDALGIESQVIKTAFAISLLLTTITAVMAMIFIYI